MTAKLTRFLRTHSLRLATVFTLGASALMAACGSGGNIVDPLVPTRILAVGDSQTDLGQAGSKFTVNDGTVNIWTQRVATSYNSTLTASVNPGGLSFATSGARITGTNSIASQISALPAMAAKDVLLIEPGVSEMVALVADRQANVLTSDAALNAAATAAGAALANEVLRALTLGSSHVIVVSMYDLGRSPYGTTNGATTISSAVAAFNLALIGGLPTTSDNLLYIYAESFYNPLFNNSTTAAMTTLACPGIASACTTANATTSYALSVFADDRHFTPNVHRSLGDFVYNRIRNRW